MVLKHATLVSASLKNILEGEQSAPGTLSKLRSVPGTLRNLEASAKDKTHALTL